MARAYAKMGNYRKVSPTATESIRKTEAGIPDENDFHHHSDCLTK